MSDPHTDEIARRFHEAYERLAPSHSYETRTESAVPWEQVPEKNRALMRDVVRALMDDGYIDAGPELRVRAEAEANLCYCTDPHPRHQPRYLLAAEEGRL